MSSKVLPMIAAWVSWSTFFLSTNMTFQRAAEGDDLGDDVMSVCSLTARVYCLSLIDKGGYGGMFSLSWVFLVILICAIAVTALFPLPSDTFFLGLIAFFTSTTLFWMFCTSVGWIQSCGYDGKILACLLLFLMVLAYIAWGSSSAELHCEPHKWSPMIPQIASLYAPNGIKPNDLRPILHCRNLYIVRGCWRNFGSCSFYC